MKMRSLGLVALSFWALSAYASAINVGLGTADSFAVLAGSIATPNNLAAGESNAATIINLGGETS